MTRLGPHTITVRRAGSKAADYGNSTQLDWSPGAVTDTDVPNCSVQPVPAFEDTVDRDNVRYDWIVWAPTTTENDDGDVIDVDVTARDRIVYAGDVYDIDGEPERWQFKRLEHLVLRLRRSNG